MGTVTGALVVAILLWRESHWSMAVVTVAVMLHPGMALLVVLGLAARARIAGEMGITPDREAALLRNLAAELDGGASVRAALARTFHHSGHRLVRALGLGYPDSVVSAELERLLPLNGRRAAVAISVGATSGASLGRVVGLLASRAADRGHLLRERRALTAQARATAWLISGLPVAVVAFGVGSGRLAESAALPVVVIGLTLQGAGMAIVMAMLRRTG